MNCQTVDELSGAWALDSLPEDERLEFEAHIATCDNHPELNSLRAAASTLALAADPVPPSAGLRSRIVAAAQAEAAPAAPVFLAEHRDSRSRRWSTRLPYAIAAAFGLLAFGLLLWNVSLRDSDDTQEFALSGDAGSGTVTTYESADRVVVELAGLSDPPSGMTYQVWAIMDGTPVSLGVITVTDGTGALDATVEVAAMDAVAVTVEPAGGSDVPTSAPVLQGVV